MVKPSNFSKDETFETHQWKTQFAAERAGSSSPNLYSKFRKLLRSPPVRNAKSPTFSQEELDALTTTDLPYQTNYTYAYSNLYDPSLPDHWEVPNIAMSSPSPDFTEEHWAAVSLSKRIFYFVTLPLVLTAHVVLYILNSLKNGTTITVLTIFEYLYYMIQQLIGYWSTWFTRRQETSYVRKYNSKSFWTRIIEFLSIINEYVWSVASAPYKSFKKWRELKQYEYKSIRGDLEKEKEERSRQITVSQLRKVRGPSFSPARGTRRSTRSTTTTTVYSSEKANDNDANYDDLNDTPIRSRNSVHFRQPVFDTPDFRDSQEAREAREDTPLSVYGLRSRNVERNTPEPTYEAHLVKKTESTGKPRQRTILKSGSVFSAAKSVSFSSAEGDSSSSAVSDLVQSTFSQLWSFAQSTLLVLIFLVFIPYEIVKYTLTSAFNFIKSSGSLENFYNQQLEKSQYVFDEKESTSSRILGLILYSPLFLTLWISNSARSSVAYVKNNKSFWPFLLLSLLLLLFFILPFFLSNEKENEVRKAVVMEYSEKSRSYLSGWLNVVFAAANKIFSSIWFAVSYTASRVVDIVFEFFAFFTGTPNHIVDKFGKLFGAISLYVNWIIEAIINGIFWFFNSLDRSIYKTQEIIYKSIYVPVQHASHSAADNVIGIIPNKSAVLGWFAFFGEIIKSIGSSILALIVLVGKNISSAYAQITERPPTQTIILPAGFDQAALKAEIYEKLRAEIKNELNLELESKYLTIINEVKSQHTNINIDSTSLEALIRKMIYEYDSDKTGLVDYALESSGASILSTRCSETYNSYSRLEKIWSIPLWYSTYGPRTVIQRNSKTLFPGECWSFKSGRGYLTIDLSHHIDLSSISYEHIGKELAPDGNRQSAPKDFKIWAYQHVDDIKTRYLIGEYTYNLDGPQLQFFPAQNTPGFPVKIVELEVGSNYGAIFTCLYRLRVHGKVHHF